MEILGYNKEELMTEVSKLLPVLRSKISGVANYGYVEVSEKKVLLNRRDSSTACLSGMIYYKEQDEVASPVLVVYDMACTRGSVNLHKDRVLWGDWVSKESPWRHCFVMLDEVSPSINGCLVSRCDISSNYLATANNILRIGIENPSKYYNWLALVKAGVNKSLAFSLCSYDVTVSDIGITFGIHSNYWSHSILNKTSSVDMLNLLVGKTLPNEGYSDEPFHSRKTYQGASGYLQDLGGGLVLDLIAKSCDVKLAGTSLGEDLMGRCLGKVKGTLVTVEQLNKFWSDYVSAD